MTSWKLAARADKMNPSVLREILKVAERPGVISLAGGLPSPATFPVAAFAAACATVLADDGAAALQYASRSKVNVGDRIAVYDLCGGTFDVCVLENT